MASIKAIQDVLAVLKEDGTTQRFESRMTPFNERGNELFDVVGLSGDPALERKNAAD